MLNFKCRNCGGEMSVSRNGDLICSYCGSKNVFSDRDLAEYKAFRRRMLEYLSAVANQSVTDAQTGLLWDRAETAEYESADGDPVQIRCIHRTEVEGITVFLARKNLILVFPEVRRNDARRFLSAVGGLDYPQADVRALSQYFPECTGDISLSDGGRLLILAKPEELYPLSAFGRLPAVHAAWIVSRMENLCCVLEYSNMAHRCINPDTVYINARTHEAYLLGGWWLAGSCEGGSRQDLSDLRRTALRILGTAYNEAPKAFQDFLNEAPARDAYTDFEMWDKVINTGFGGRRFEKLDLTSLQL